MSKLFYQAVVLAVKEDKNHRPVSFLYRGKREKVAEIMNQWRVSQKWWKGAIEREYFQVMTETGIVCELYRDLPDASWYLQRICD